MKAILVGGILSLALAAPALAANTATIVQNATRFNGALTVQAGPTNTSTVVQTGRLNKASSFQYGRNNDAAIGQTGRFNGAGIFQYIP